MAKSKFTSGPLSVERNDWQDDPWGIIAGNVSIGVAIETGVEGEAKANAELWADAPRMLEVLRGIRDAENNVDLYITLKLADELLEKHGG